MTSLNQEPRKFKLEILNKEKGLFLDASPGRIVLGPRSSPKKKGEDDHITVVLNGDSINQVHRKVDGREVWHHTGESLQAELDSVLANATESVNVNEFRTPKIYIVSVKRIKLLFSVLTLLVSLFMGLSWRLFASAEIAEYENAVTARITFSQHRIQRFIQSARLPLSLLSKVGFKIPPNALLKPLRFVVRWILVDSQDVPSLKGDLLFVVSEKHVGFISPGDGGKVKFTSVLPLFAAYERLSDSVPVTLDDIGDLGTGSEVRIKASCDQTPLAGRVSVS
jgi:hypothetical protein